MPYLIKMFVRELFLTKWQGFSAFSANFKISILLENCLVSRHFGFVKDILKLMHSYASCCELLVPENIAVRSAVQDINTAKYAKKPNSSILRDFVFISRNDVIVKFQKLCKILDNY